MANILYGVDLDSEVTPLMVRDAIVECFWQAHCMDTGISDEEAELNKAYCKSIVEKTFKESNGDFNNPKKEDILNCVKGLSSFAKNFRNQELVEKHYNEISQIVSKLK